MVKVNKTKEIIDTLSDKKKKINMILLINKLLQTLTNSSKNN